MRSVNPDTAQTAPVMTRDDGRVNARDGTVARRIRGLLDKLRPPTGLFPMGQASALHMREEIERLRNDKIHLQAAIDALARAEAQASHDAVHDALTGLPNRSLLRDRFRQAIALCERQKRQIAVLFLDLDDFKRVNDDFGHIVGDKVLRDVAAHLQATIRTADTACRYGGDEFVVLLTDIEPATSATDWATMFCQRLAAQPRFGGINTGLRASIGVAVYPDDGHEWEDLVRHADAAMYRARAQHRSARQRLGADLA
jgi:diguanylate cyclase (GGDEF)-like protein